MNFLHMVTNRLRRISKLHFFALKPAKCHVNSECAHFISIMCDAEHCGLTVCGSTISDPAPVHLGLKMHMHNCMVPYLKTLLQSEV